MLNLILGTPSGMLYPHKISANIGQTVSFVCDFQRPKKWKFNSQDLPNNAKISGKLNRVLTITNVQSDNEGIYTCLSYKNRFNKMKNYGLLYIGKLMNHDVVTRHTIELIIALNYWNNEAPKVRTQRYQFITNLGPKEQLVGY